MGSAAGTVDAGCRVSTAVAQPAGKTQAIMNAKRILVCMFFRPFLFSVYAIAPAGVSVGNHDIGTARVTALLTWRDSGHGV